MKRIKKQKSTLKTLEQHFDQMLRTRFDIVTRK